MTQHQGQVVLANGIKLPTAGIGEGYIECMKQNGEYQRIKITDVLYVPELKGNLLSVRKLTAKNFVVEFESSVCKITKRNTCVAYATESKGLYELSMSDTVITAKQYDEKNCIHTLYNRFGHCEPEAIKRLVHQATDFHIEPCSAPILCECCIQAKMHRKPFPKKATSTSAEILDLVHSDVCSPMQIATPSGNRYFLMMIDDYSRYTKVYLLKNKSEVPAKVTEYAKYIQTKFNKTPKVIRSDRGGEYTGDNLTRYFRSEGIQVKHSVPYTPQQNGVAERITILLK